MNKSIIVNLKNVSKKYSVSGERDGKFYALKNIDLVIKKGDRIGIMGNNGAGKSTLLKIISEVIKPSFGSVDINGKVVSLMSLESGFKFDLTGRENILLNGLLAGMTTLEIKKKMEEIIKYSELKDFIDEPFYKYSAGMKFRLAFSIAIASYCDLLILDEILMSGDFSFQRKAFKTLTKFQNKKKGMATIICSHLPDLVWAFANRYFLMKNGGMDEISRDKMIFILREKNFLWKNLLDLNMF